METQKLRAGFGSAAGRTAQISAYNRACIDAADEIDRLRAALDVAMTVLEQIATTPRNRGAKKNAYAAHAFIKANFRASDA